MFPFSDLSGGQDGSVVLWEFNHQLPISTPRSPGTFAKVTRVAFNQQGNKFGVADTDGNLSLWQVLAGHSKPYFVSVEQFVLASKTYHAFVL